MSMHANTGRRLLGLDIIRQSIVDILTTPIGTRVMRRNYGSLLFDLIDQPHNGITQIRLYAATAAALLKWEPRLKLTQVNIYRTDIPGRVLLEVKGKVMQSSNVENIDMSIPLTIRGNT